MQHGTIYVPHYFPRFFRKILPITHNYFNQYNKSKSVTLELYYKRASVAFLNNKHFSSQFESGILLNSILSDNYYFKL